MSISFGTTNIQIYTVSVTKALSAATAYDANDVVSETATNGVGTAWTFAGCARTNGGSGYITKAHVISETSAITPRLSLFLFTALPTSELDDHAGNTALLHADLANYVGKIDFPAMEKIASTADSEAMSVPSTTGNLPMAFTCASTTTSLFGILVTRDAFTQVAGDDMVVRLTVEQS